MKKAKSVMVGTFLVALCALLASPAAASTSTRTVGEQWASRLDPALGIPARLAIRAANAAIAHGMTPGQVTALFNYEPFAMAIGASDQGYATLEAMTKHPEWIENAFNLMSMGRDRYTISGVTSFQTAMFGAVPELRNEYLSDLGFMVAMDPNGVEVLVDIESGRQALGDGVLGRRITAPGGGSIKAPAVSPVNIETQPPGFNPTFAPDDRFTKFLYVFSGLALLLGLGVPAAKWAVRRLSAD